MAGIPANLKGRLFGKSLVLALSHIDGDEKFWRLRCSCGNEYTAGHRALQRGVANTKNCGCRKQRVTRNENIVGRRFGKLTIKSQVGSNRNGRLWECLCDCGKMIATNTADLVSVGIRSCGCDNPVGKFRGIGELGLTYFSSILKGARKRRIPVEVDIVYLYQLYTNQGGVCALTGLMLSLSYDDHTASLDRIDSSKGYVVGNLRWVHKVVNIMRRTMADEEFVWWCRKVVEYSDNQLHLISKGEDSD